jgi:hypothetical protein
VKADTVTGALKQRIIAGRGNKANAGIPDRPDRGRQPGQHQGLGEPDRGVLRPGVAVMDGPPAEGPSLPGPQRGCLADRLLHERGLLAQRAFPAGDQPGEGVDAEGGVPEAAAVHRHIAEVSTCSWPGRPAVKFRFTRSGARVCAGSGTVVRILRARVTPRHRFARISRSTVHRATATPCRFRCSHIFRLPYSDSGLRGPR